MRQRLRPAHTPEQLAEIYRAPHDHRRWRDHQIRVDATIELARAHITARTGADLSCGNGTILASLDLEERHFGDYAPGYEHTGPIESTIEQVPHVGVFVCCETLEHLDDPDAVLKAIRAKTDALVLSTPVDAWDDQNLEHYWAWSREDVERMLDAAGFAVTAYRRLTLRPGFLYDYGIWCCS